MPKRAVDEEEVAIGDDRCIGLPKLCWMNGFPTSVEGGLDVEIGRRLGPRAREVGA